jgi:threonine dehydrogenase-like Zn-dependent dehydrogenase
MKAARYHGPRDIRIETIPDPPPPGPNEVTLDVLWGGICGTDLSEYTSGPISIPTKPHKVTGDCLPVSFGHEFFGRISALPEGYSGAWKLDQPIMVDPRLPCRECTACTSELDNICSNWGYLGLHGGGGGGAGFSEKVNVQQRMCFELPDDGSVGLERGNPVLCQSLTVGRHAISQVDVGGKGWEDTNVLVLGAGPVGLAVLLNMRARGMGSGRGKVWISEPTKKRREMVEKMNLCGKEGGAIDPAGKNVVDVCKEGTDGRGVDVVFDAAGVEIAMKAGMEALKLRGTYVNIAGWKSPFSIPLQFAMQKEVVIKFSFGNNDLDYKAVVEDFSAGKFGDTEALITRRLPVEELAEKGLEELSRNKDEHVKIIATWRKDLLQKL